MKRFTTRPLLRSARPRIAWRIHVIHPHRTPRRCGDHRGLCRRAAATPLAVAARNPAAGPAGVVGRLRVVAAGGTTELVTDASWKAASTVGPDWTEPATGDAAWPAAQVSAGYGTGPWASGVT